MHNEITSQRLIWLDLEMTGLNTDNNVIIEIATLITDGNLEEIAEGPSLAIYQPEVELDKMDDWNREHHGSSGLLDRVRASKVSLKEAEETTLDFLQGYLKAGESPLCGNSICTDRRFLAKHMPELNRFFHYRHLDVSTIKILAQNWYPDVARAFTKESSHLALNDIRDSIEELQYYRNNIFIPE